MSYPPCPVRPGIRLRAMRQRQKIRPVAGRSGESGRVCARRGLCQREPGSGKKGMETAGGRDGIERRGNGQGGASSVRPEKCQGGKSPFGGLQYGCPHHYAGGRRRRRIRSGAPSRGGAAVKI